MRYLTALATFSCCLLANVAAYAGAPSAASAADTTAAALSATSAAATDYSLPQLGIAGGVALPLWKAHFMGEQIFHLIQGEDGVLNDPLVESYVNYVGHRLSSVAQGPDEPYHYFVVMDPDINAFALPGAFVGVNYGLILATQSEDELAGVMAHETAHVSLRHIARQMADATYNNLVDLALLLGGIAAAVAAPGIGVGAVMGGIGVGMQRGINYTRAHEFAADRVGIMILARARFKPQGMVNFFKYMESQAGLVGYQLPQFLSNHPLDITRIAEAENRAKDLHIHPLPENPNYALMRARIRVLTSDDLAGTLAWFEGQVKTETNPWYRKAAVYGMVLCLNRLDSGKRALKLIRPLANSHPNNIALQLGLAESLLAAKQNKAGLDSLAQDHVLYPENLAVTGAYARALINANQASKAVIVLKPLMDPDASVFDPDLYQLLAIAANKTGDKTLALRAMTYGYNLVGDFHSAIIQLRLILRDPKLTPVERTLVERHKKALEAERKKAKRMGLTDQGPGFENSKNSRGHFEIDAGSIPPP
ncbi:MAG: beta-barrel assembly-enhancing protease [Gammaproteobacteria bacterium]